MTNNTLKLNTTYTDIPLALKQLFWEFVRGDKIIRDFEQYIYNSKELPSILTGSSYDHLIMVEYRDKDEVFQIKQELFKLLTSIGIDCLCPTMSNATRFSITNDGPYKVLDDYSNDLLKINLIKSFSGQHPIHKSYWYFDAELSKCRVCNTLWFTVQEECFCDYYIVRLNQGEFDVINSDTSWPNEKWPERLGSWNGFSNNKFISWNDMFLPENHDLGKDTNILKNLILCIPHRI